MAQEMGVTQKTIRRDLRVFKEVGFPVEETVGDRGRKAWRMSPPSGQPPLSFAYDEALALYLARRLMEPLLGTPFWEASCRAFRKIKVTLGSGTARSWLSSVSIWIRSWDSYRHASAIQCKPCERVSASTGSRRTRESRCAPCSAACSARYAACAHFWWRVTPVRSHVDSQANSV
jgi:hypothetical protein